MNVTRIRRFAVGLCPRCGERPLHRKRKACFPCLRKGAEWVAKKREYAAAVHVGAARLQESDPWTRARL